MQEISNAIVNTSFLQKIWSYWSPVKIHEFQSFDNKLLEVFVSKGRFALAVHDTLYSYGISYTPFLKILKYFKKSNQLTSLQSVLMLGVGLGSAVQMLQKANDIPRKYDLVEIDPVILSGAQTILSSLSIDANYIVDDAIRFVDQNTKQYDLVNLDVFSEKIVPEAILTKSFHQKLHKSVQQNGYMCMNYMDIDDAKTLELEHTLQQLYDKVVIIELMQNKIYICKA